MKAGSRDWWMPAAYGSVGVAITGVLLSNGQWSFGLVDGTCAMLMVFAIVGWRSARSTVVGTYFAVVAMMIAGGPIMAMAIESPAAWTLILWAPCAISNGILYAVATSWRLRKPEEWTFFFFGFVYNGAMVWINWP